MSLIRQIIDAIEEAGESSIDTLAPQFPQYSREQVSRALHNASFRRRIVTIKKGRMRGRGKGSAPSTFGPAPKEARATTSGRPAGVANSIWQWGAI